MGWWGCPLIGSDTLTRPSTFLVVTAIPPRTRPQDTVLCNHTAEAPEPKDAPLIMTNENQLPVGNSIVSSSQSKGGIHPCGLCGLSGFTGESHFGGAEIQLRPWDCIWGLKPNSESFDYERQHKHMNKGRTPQSVVPYSVDPAVVLIQAPLRIISVM